MGNIGKKSISFRVGHLTITAEAEYYGKNCADRGECQHNSLNHTKAEFIKCFIICSKYFQAVNKVTSS